ncbi:phosphatidylglycerol lysyltransferase domain-containing protein [uncultured Litoreibacter sp.]|uniref:phosphatidylglycerol lysyltransferase domain-containing protein n=1 Tax=uncultured Litoreibacter sp. TaxID=1392394 RepID=UPI00262F615E|nr:phosphatidylglycerol lysyltransferase domain-containing protein [uncultured Litoreibacter sp.]
MATLSKSKFKHSRLMRQLGMMLISLVGVALLYNRSTSIDLAAAYRIFQEFSIFVWLLAAICTAISLASVGGYDVLVARYLKLPISTRPAFAAGWRATAIAQTLGFGLFTGSLARWKLLSSRPEFSLWQATRMTGAVTAFFFGGWAIVTSVVVVLTPDIAPQLWWLGLLGLWTVACFLWVSISTKKRFRHPLPSIRLVGVTTALTLIDTLTACVVIYCFLPDSYVTFFTLYSAFLVAYCVGMISGIPGGLGPFELCLITLLPIAESSPLLAAVLAYRITYFAGPVIAAIVTLKLARFSEKTTAQPVFHPLSSPTAPAEISLLAQGQLSLITHKENSSCSLGCYTENSEILFRDPFGGDPEEFLKARRTAARRSFKGLLAYKIGRGAAAAARSAGLSVHQIGSEALLHPKIFTPNTPKHSQLRRKLRNSAKSAVTVARDTPTLAQIENIERDWQSRNGPARGFSVGRTHPMLMAHQAVFTAYRNSEPIAFATFHVSRDRWVLDLMRSQNKCPDGTNHALVIAAVEAAKQENVAVVSLCSVPQLILSRPRSWLERLIKRTYRHNSSALGLHQFKSSFDPDWTPQFVAADSILTLFLSGFEVYSLIHTPPESLHQKEDLEQIHDHYDDYQFDSSSLACEEAR